MGFLLKVCRFIALRVHTFNTVILPSRSPFDGPAKALWEHLALGGYSLSEPRKSFHAVESGWM